MPDRPWMVRGYSNTSTLRECKASRADQRSRWVRIVIHRFTAQSYADEMMNGSTEFTLSPDPSQGSGCVGSEGLTDHEWNPRSQCLHPTLTFFRYSVGIPVCLAKIESLFDSLIKFRTLAALLGCFEKCPHAL